MLIIAKLLDECVKLRDNKKTFVKGVSLWHVSSSMWM